RYRNRLRGFRRSRAEELQPAHRIRGFEQPRYPAAAGVFRHIATLPGREARDSHSGAGAMSATNVGTLLWQSRTRIVVVVLIVIVWIMLRFRGSESTAGSIAHAVLEPSTILYIALGGVVAYLLATVAVYVYARRRKKAGAGLVIAALVMDVALLFLATVLTTPIGYFERALLISIFVLQFALLYRGMTTAVVTGVVVSAMYAGLLLLASRVGYDLQWNQEIWTLILFLAAVFGMLALQGNASRRLEHLAFLFERMQSGDFSERYDERRD